ncbi:hypothetical protein HZH68_015004 [Vespula germanica]|uniref:Uncharacterized protein n=1 Tax=Vespula germanica TaxID=30212 RepID=A0A834J840_VESGE|nr:hypothetical protein HZH68_015004 [Vespula germanica]
MAGIARTMHPLGKFQMPDYSCKWFIIVGAGAKSGNTTRALSSLFVHSTAAATAAAADGSPSHRQEELSRTIVKNNLTSGGTAVDDDSGTQRPTRRGGTITEDDYMNEGMLSGNDESVGGGFHYQRCRRINSTEKATRITFTTAP